MLEDTCKCGAKFQVAYGGLHAPIEERVAHASWLAAHAPCRTAPTWPPTPLWPPVEVTCSSAALAAKGE